MIGAWQADRQQTVTAEDRLAAFEAGISIEEYLRRNRPH